MAARGIPVIHLLDVRTLALRHGLPWDPVPLPRPGSTRLTREGPERGAPILVIAAVWLGAIIVIFFTAPVKIPRRTHTPIVERSGHGAHPDPPGDTHDDVP
jgi:hypothetical protein